ncbi:sensor domain-containing diguanylate cyclase [Bacillus sp. HMF5848]|uniref:sensor domain-containing diguanylate cyclase n=1 Tax=Bacillus sp. HMF5848 TaxID=2495421 RepID=UPI000F78D266|nr:sensor domain-containing diguanylate cyclase [Bacillus sp. HMF5848]RSK28035.1 sensor domain-containing diguanylate cyclase [Bacillus sp. HMF5848]
MVTRRFQIYLYVLYLLLAPVVLYYVYIQDNNLQQLATLDYVLFTIIMVVVSLFPIVINGTPILFAHGVSLVIFLTYGLLAEIIAMQVTVVLLMLRLRVSKSESYRLPLNLLIFLIGSLVSGLAYYSLGGTHSISQPLTFTGFFIPVVAYVVAKYVSNTTIVLITKRLLMNEKMKYFTRETLWDVVSELVVFPLGLILFILYYEVGREALIYIGGILIILSAVLQMFYKSQQVNYYLQKASEIGHQLAERLDVEKVIDLFTEKIFDMLPIEHSFIFDVDENDNLILIQYVKNGKKRDHKIDFEEIPSGEGIVYKAFQTKAVVLYDSQEHWDIVTSQYIPKTCQSVLAVPIMRHSYVAGVLVVTSRKKRAFEKYQLMIMDILSSYLAVAAENARHYEETKKRSEHCALTNLYNYYYFETVLEKQFNRLQYSKEINNLSLILLDIDHFKRVNDTYGHQSGNVVLCEIAKCLKQEIGDRGIVARYGGEEFVILLPDVDWKQCYQYAECIRLAIANTPFPLQNDLSDKTDTQSVSVTVSIGIATAPEDADDAQSLVRHADRAMYVGAKQAGRNRVAEYLK